MLINHQMMIPIDRNVGTYKTNLIIIRPVSFINKEFLWEWIQICILHYYELKRWSEIGAAKLQLIWISRNYFWGIIVQKSHISCSHWLHVCLNEFDVGDYRNLLFVVWSLSFSKLILKSSNIFANILAF